ncbi:MAG: ABC transporter substrate-binding protein [Bacillota bacterium]
MNKWFLLGQMNHSDANLLGVALHRDKEHEINGGFTMKLKRLLVFMVIILTVVLLIAGCGGKASTVENDKDSNVPKYGGVANWVLYAGDPENLDPQINRAFIAHWAVSPVYNRLIKPKVGPDIHPNAFVPEGDLAEKWDISDDGLEYTFYLRKGVKWHDVPPLNGREFVSSDVRFNFERISELKGPQYDFFSNIVKIETPDNYTVKFILKNPQASFLRYLAAGISSIVAPEAVDEFGDLTNVAIGTGPFIMEKYDRGVGITYKANPNYFKGKPYLDGLQFLIIPDESARIAAFRAGQLDLANYVSVTAVESIKPYVPEAYIKEYHSSSTIMFWMQTQRRPFDNLKVRQAINYAIDKKAIIEVIALGAGTLSAPVSSSYEEWTLPEKEREDYNRYDPEYAKQLLKEAGYENGFKTEIKLATYGSDAYTNMASMLTEYLAAIGIEADIKIVEYAVGLQIRRTGDFDLYLGPQSPMVEIDQLLGYQYETGAFLNHSMYSDPRLDEMLIKQRQEMDIEKRKEIVLEIQRYIMDNAMPNVLLYDSVTNWTVQPWVKDFAFNFDYGNVNWDKIWINK